MVLNLEHEFAYQDKPIIPVRFSNGDWSVTTEAMLDTGAEITLIDAELAQALHIHPDAVFELTVVGVAVKAGRVGCSWLEVAIPGLPANLAITKMMVGFAPRLTRTVGNLLGRNFLEHFDLGLHHHPFPPPRRLYLGGV